MPGARRSGQFGSRHSRPHRCPKPSVNARRVPERTAHERSAHACEAPAGLTPAMRCRWGEQARLARAAAASMKHSSAPRKAPVLARPRRVLSLCDLCRTLCSASRLPPDSFPRVGRSVGFPFGLESSSIILAPPGAILRDTRRVNLRKRVDRDRSPRPVDAGPPSEASPPSSDTRTSHASPRRADGANPEGRSERRGWAELRVHGAGGARAFSRWSAFLISGTSTPLGGCPWRNWRRISSTICTHERV